MDQYKEVNIFQIKASNGLFSLLILYRLTVLSAASVFWYTDVYIFARLLLRNN